MRRTGLYLFVTFFILFFFGGEASACTCGQATVAEYLDSAKAVFLGEVVSKKKSDLLEKNGVEVNLEVHKVWKGSVKRTTLVYTGATEDLYAFLNLCATPFRVGQKYIVFAYGTEKLSTDVCSGTGDFPYAKGVVRKLGKARPPLKSKTDAVSIVLKG